MLLAFIHGCTLAFGLILPLGPQNALVFTQGATQPRFIRALPVILTAALCDTLLILLAAAGRLVGRADRVGNIRKILNRVSAVVMWVSAVYLALTLLS